jgi:hypothetical protein
MEKKLAHPAEGSASERGATKKGKKK